MNVEIVTEAAQFPEKEYINGILLAVYTQRQHSENLKQIFTEMKLCGLSPNSYIHVSVSDLYVPTIGAAGK
jgi:hypothetical protein